MPGLLTLGLGKTLRGWYSMVCAGKQPVTPRTRAALAAERYRLSAARDRRCLVPSRSFLSGLAALWGPGLDSACAAAVIWQLGEAGPGRSARVRSVRASRNRGWA